MAAPTERPTRQQGSAPPAHLMGKRDEWPDDVAATVRLVVVAQLLDIRIDMQDGLQGLTEGVTDLDYQLLVGGLRKVILAGEEAKLLADHMVRWYGGEAVDL